MSADDSGSVGSKQVARTDEDASEADVSNLDSIGTESRSNGSALSKGEIFDLLKNSRRRSIIHYLRRNDGYAELNDLAERIAADENDITVRELSSDQRKRVYIGLYQCHLPKMDALGVVEYDKNRGTIELQDSVTQLSKYMESPGDGEETSERPERQWLVTAIAATVVAVVTVGTLGLGPLSALPTATWTAVGVAGLLCIVGLQYLE